MTRRITLLFLLVTLVFATDSSGNSTFEYGPRPPSGIFDPTGFLSAEATEQISKPLASYRTKDSIDVIVVILSEIGDAPPEHVARQFSKAWCDPLLNCIVLHVPGNPDGPWIVPQGKIVQELLNPKVVGPLISQAERRASLEIKEDGKVRAATTEAADLLRIWMGVSEVRIVEVQQQKVNFREMMEKRLSLRKLALPAFLIATLLLFGLIYGAVVARQKFRSRVFPKTRNHNRLGAPYAGGNDAYIDLGPTVHRH